MIIRVEHRDHFTVVRNQTLRDSRLSYKATGLLAYLLSLSDDSTLSREHLTDAKNDGARSVRSALKELTDCGYIEHRTVQNERGRWTTEATVYERPKRNRTDGAFRAIGRQPADGAKRATLRSNKERTASQRSAGSAPERPATTGEDRCQNPKGCHREHQFFTGGIWLCESCHCNARIAQAAEQRRQADVSGRIESQGGGTMK